MLDNDSVIEIGKVADETGLQKAALLAIAEVESGGHAFAVVDGRREPLIRFEGHYFDRRLGGDERVRARTAGLANPAAGAIANPASQTARWAMLGRAAAINHRAAHESVSWGLGQVMGAHWAWLGFASVDALVAEARSGAAGQARLMLRYIDKAGLRKALQERDWAAFSRGYNGPAYRRNRYDTKLAAAYARYSAGQAIPAPKRNDTPLKSGARGETVRDLQSALSATGYPVAVDGVFGPATQAALRHFQRDHGLQADGIAGPLTRKALEDGLSGPGPSGPSLTLWAQLLNWLSRWWRG